MFSAAGRIYFWAPEQQMACLPKSVREEEVPHAINLVCGHLELCVEGLRSLAKQETGPRRNQALRKQAQLVISLRQLSHSLGEHVAPAYMNELIYATRPGENPET